MTALLQRYSWTAEIDSLSTTYDVFKFMRGFADSFGFQKFCIVEVPWEDAKLSEVNIINNWDPEFVQAYDALNLAKNSPIFQHVRKSTMPLVFDVGSVQAQSPTEKRQDAMDAFQSFRATKGIIIPVHSANGVRGAVSLTGKEVALTQTQTDALHATSIHLFQHLMGTRQHTQNRGYEVSRREQECLKWAAMGKTSGEIGSIIGLSETTVNHHITAVCKKLDVSNRVHAVAKAIRCGLID